MKPLRIVFFIGLFSLLTLAATPTPEPVRKYRIHLAMTIIQRPLVGAQDETHGAYLSVFPEDSVAHYSIRWDKGEPEPGQYVWESGLGEVISRAYREKVKVIIGTRASPEWARLKPDWTCSQPKTTAYDDYARWVNAIIDKYHPWGIEIWNEPDVGYNDVSQDWWIMGCFLSGSDYAQFVNTVIPIVKAHSPETKILIGALMLDGDDQGRFARSLTYAKGYDYLSYHAYVYAGTGRDDVILEKADLLRSMIVPTPPLFVTETSMLDYGDKCSPAFEQLKDEYAAHARAGLGPWGLSGALWYTIGGNGWKCSDLLPGIGYDYWFYRP